MLRTLLVAALLLVTIGARGDEPAGALATLVEDIWQYRLRESPEFASRVGDRRYNDRLTAVSVADSDRRAAETAAFLERSRAIDRAGLDRAGRLEVQLIERALSESLTEHASGDHLVPLSSWSGFHIDFPELPDWAPLATVEDYEDYLARLRAFPAYAEGNLDLMREGVRRGWTVPAVILEGWEKSVDTHTVDDPETSVFFKPFAEFPDAVPPAERERLVAESRVAIAEAIVPTYRRFRRFMADEYLPSCRATIGASALPGGRDFYRHRVRKYTTLDLTPEEVHRTGLAEVARIRAEMAAIAQRVGFDGDLAAFEEHLKTDEAFYEATEDALLARTAAILKRADGELPKLFGRLPRMPYGLKPVPDYSASKAPAAYYQRPNGDGTRAGFFFLNTFNLPSRPTYTLEA
ncbi:MAG: DUF885 domain-containing protein, partial [Planctomycetota bacterium]